MLRGAAMLFSLQDSLALCCATPQAPSRPLAPTHLSFSAGTDSFCICEPGYTTDNCAVRICPKGDDPMTEDQRHRQITITTGAQEGTLGGNFDFTFMGHTVGFDAQPTITSLK